MVQSVELLLDAEADAAIRAIWSALINAGLPSAGRHTGTSNAPHITMAVARRIPDQAEAGIALAGQAISWPLPLRLGGLVVFGRPLGPFVLARLVTTGEELLAAQRAIVGEIPEANGGSALPTTRPGHWTPHITLARRMSADQVGLALPLAASDDGEASAVTLRRWDGEAKRQWLIAPAR